MEPVNDIERCSDLCLEPVSPEDLEKLVRELSSWYSSVHTPQPNTSPRKPGETGNRAGLVCVCTHLLSI